MQRLGIEAMSRMNHLTQPPSSHPLRSLFLDMDSYFASVEQYLEPQLRGRPIGVAPMLVESTCCIAASYEAKAYGVKTGTRVSDARTMCPEITIVQARPPLYIDIHHKIVEIVESCIHVDHVLSIDEMLCWLPLNWRDDEKVEAIGLEIKTKLNAAFEGALRCTIGVAPNGWLAKVASKMRKPDGFFIVKDEDLPHALYPLELIDLHGIGKNMEMRFHAHGVHTVEELYGCSKETLAAIWGGVGGSRLWHKLRGEEISDIDANPTKRSIGHGHVLPPEYRAQAKAITVIHRLVQKAAFRARSHGLMAGALSLQVKYTNFTSWEESLVFGETGDCLFLTKAITAIWRNRPDRSSPLMKVNIVLSRLVPEGNHTPSLFQQEANDNKALNEAMAEVVSKFGKQALYLGGAHGAMEAAQPKIAFQHIPDLRTES